MKLHLAAFNDGRGWQPIRKKGKKNHTNLCVYDNYDSAVRAIRKLKYRYPEETEFNVFTFGVEKFG
ncbi:hypothetical protein C5L30_000251 [Companilactobacillus farciminis]|uniref:Uncharacterized protein n=1 Tax=Companilactobacillus farciminis TaxID=1612 RepID=A0A4R5NIX2_9LACO|nr:hypothetical protein [Companilactobacillus farciminis]ATO46098.1 hypothetical protein LF20184_04720 [Companilactobacillus farciminis KCTC 3681 = DSM 20184]TDG74535.1 hypothetical protein C5L30_000251 [Companilactobacillus farciminis]